MDKRPPKILYIMGTARSGSTILEVLLSKGKDIFGAGEVTHLIYDGFIENGSCSCRNLFRQCPVWGNVAEALGEKDYQQWAALEHKVDWHAGFIRQIISLLTREEKAKYRELNSQLLEAIQEATECQKILDSSKYAGRALALSTIPDIDLSVICLTRSPEGLIAAFQKPNIDEQKPKGSVGVIIYYLVTLLSLRIALFKLGNRAINLRYEDFLADPQNSLDKIEKLCDIDLSETKRALKANEFFPVGHMVTGNRLRKKGAIRFEPKIDNLPPLRFGARAAVIIMNGWRWLLRF